ncbi:MAG: penicillin-binding protein 2 [Patescibacteria group bacterium]|nr:penicillin-binding protein 2 [Patescibacteria group bacterium]
MVRSFGVHREDFRPTDVTGRRVLAIGVVFFLCCAFIVLRLFDLQVLRFDYFSSMAAKAQDTFRELAPERGAIYVKEGGKLYPLVSNRDYYLVYADPRKVTDAGKVVDTLAQIMHLSEEEWKPIAAKLSNRRDPYEPLLRKVGTPEVELIRRANLPGIADVAESYRYYPETEFGGQLLGFVGYADDALAGQYGLEGYFEPELAGKAGSLRAVTDAVGRPLVIGERELEEPQDGMNLVLTVDRTVQLTACAKLKDGVAAYDAVGGTVIIMQPETGAILAMCSVPNFDPGDYAQVSDPAAYNNPAIFTAYEPGSVFKPITMASAIDRGLVRPTDTYEDTGEIKLATGAKIRNSDLQAHGVQTMVQVLEKSLNTGAVHVVMKLGREQFRRYVRDFGFGSRTGITLDTEVSGDVSSLDRRGEIYSMTASYGQGITVTPLQLAAAYGALANNGKLMRPYIVSEQLSADGEVAVSTAPQVVRQVVTSRTASTITGMLVQAVEGVYDHKAKLPGYYVAGKTGTAQIASPNGGYGDEVNHTFIGYLPAYRPAFVILVKLDKPTKVKHAADSTTVVFRQISEFLVDYYQIAPERDR